MEVNDFCRDDRTTADDLSLANATSVSSDKDDVAKNKSHFEKCDTSDSTGSVILKEKCVKSVERKQQKDMLENKKGDDHLVLEKAALDVTQENMLLNRVQKSKVTSKGNDRELIVTPFTNVTEETDLLNCSNKVSSSRDELQAAGDVQKGLTKNKARTGEVDELKCSSTKDDNSAFSSKVLHSLTNDFAKLRDRPNIFGTCVPISSENNEIERGIQQVEITNCSAPSNVIEEDSFKKPSSQQKSRKLSVNEVDNAMFYASNSSNNTPSKKRRSRRERDENSILVLSRSYQDNTESGEETCDFRESTKSQHKNGRLNRGAPINEVLKRYFDAETSSDVNLSDNAKKCFTIRNKSLCEFLTKPRDLNDSCRIIDPDLEALSLTAGDIDGQSSESSTTKPTYFSTIPAWLSSNRESSDIVLMEHAPAQSIRFDL